MPEALFYFTGGTVPRDASCYVTREADERLLRALRAGEFCYVLTARQMGKSSLMTRTALRLREEGAAVAVLDLTAFGRNLTAEQWYDQLLARIGRELKLEDELDDFWLGNERLPPLVRFMTALTEVVLAEKKGGVVLFLDEIDLVRSLNFDTDEFFAAIRELFNRRVSQPDLKRLTFCLLGVASPSDLIKDPRITPFNTGTRIELTDFSEKEAAPLAEGFGAATEVATSALRRVLHWTGGHPYLTQRLCRIASESGALSEKAIDDACREHFLDPQAQGAEDNLRFVGDRLLRATDDKHAVLDRYREVLAGRRVVLDETDSIQETLRLSGIVRVQGGRLALRNRIYERVFDAKWIERHTESAEKRRQAEAYRKGLTRAIGIAAAVGAVLVTLSLVAFQQATIARTREQRAENLAYIANVNLMQREWEASPPSVARVRELLAETKPSPFRGWEWGFWDRLRNLSTTTLRGHKGLLNHAAFTRDGTRVITTADDDSARIWSLDGRQLHRFFDPNNQIIAADLSPDRSTLVCAGTDGALSFWNVTDEKKTHTVAAHAGGVRAVVYSPDGRSILSAGMDGTAKLWDAATRSMRRVFRGHTDAAFDARFSRDGRLAVTASFDGTARVWEVATGKEVRKLGGYGGKMTSAAFSPDSRRVIAGSDDTMVRVWNVADGSEALFFRSQTEPVWAVDWCPDGRKAVSAGEDGMAKVWDMTTGEELFSLKGHEWFISGAAFSPDGKRLVTASWDQTAKLWEVSESRESRVFQVSEGPVTSIGWASHPDRLIAGTQDGSLTVWDAQTRKLLRGFEAHRGAIHSLELSRKGTFALTCGGDSAARQWDLTSGERAAEYSPKGTIALCARYSVGEGSVLVGCEDGSVHRFSGAGELEQKHDGRADPVTAMALSPDGSRMAFCTRDGNVVMLDTARLHEVWRSERGRPLSTLAFNPNGQYLTVGGQDRSMTALDAASGEFKRTLKGHVYPVTSLTYSPDGKRILSGGEDRTAKLWDASTGRELLTLRGQPGNVNCVAFSTDGTLILAGGEDGSARIWFSRAEGSGEK